MFRSGAASTDILKEAVNSLRSGMVDLSSVSRELDMWSTGDDVKKVQEFRPHQFVQYQDLVSVMPSGIVDESTLNALKEATSETKNLTGNIESLLMELISWAEEKS